MYCIHVYIQVKPECIADFIEATIDNASNSNQEPGCHRFDVLRRNDAPDRFELVEIYENEAAIDAHRQSAHYARWQSVANDMMAEQRSKHAFTPVYTREHGRVDLDA
jgi:autoinducer 2-degrading protein